MGFGWSLEGEGPPVSGFTRAVGRVAEGAEGAPCPVAAIPPPPLGLGSAHLFPSLGGPWPKPAAGPRPASPSAAQPPTPSTVLPLQSLCSRWGSGPPGGRSAAPTGLNPKGASADLPRVPGAGTPGPVGAEEQPWWGQRGAQGLHVPAAPASPPSLRPPAVSHRSWGDSRVELECGPDGSLAVGLCGQGRVSSLART